MMLQRLPLSGTSYHDETHQTLRNQLCDHCQSQTEDHRHHRYFAGRSLRSASYGYDAGIVRKFGAQQQNQERAEHSTIPMANFIGIGGVSPILL